jgi:hypothetical protein
MAGPITLPFVTTFNDKGVKQGQASLSSLAKSSLAGAVSVGLVVDQLGKAVRAAAEDQKSQEQLELAVRNNTSANTLQIAEMERSIGKMESQKAVADDELRPALGNLVRATGDVTKAQGLLNLALDISSATGRDLQAVSIALAKAQTGNITALTRLGIPLDAAAVKSKDLDAIQKDLAIRFAGASDAAANSAEGGMKKLQIALDNTYEAVGKRLLPVLGDYVTVLNDIASKALNAEGSQNKFVETFVKLYGYVGPGGGLLKGIGLLNKLVGNYADSIDNARENQYDYTNINQRMNMGMRMLTVTTEENTTKTKSNTDAKKKAKEAAKEYADTLRDRVQTAMDTVTDKVKMAQDQFDSFKDSLAGQLTGFVSLSDAVKTQSEAETKLQEALKERSDAYTELNKAHATQDADDYAAALERVIAAENGVASATTARASADYSSAFRQQIADAKAFAGLLTILVNNGVSQEGVAQLMNLGPTAGRQVATDLINSTNGFSVDDYKASIADITAAGQNFGTMGANAFFGAPLAGAQAAQGQVNQYQITVNAALVSNPAQVGRDIIEAIKAAERVSGQVFVSV